MRPVASLTDFENEIVDEIVLFDAQNSSAREILCCLTPDGASEIARAVGSINRVELPLSLEDVLSAGEGVRLFHNHPSQGSLSATDWWQSIRWQGKADLIAINSKRTIFSGAARNLTALTYLLERIDLDTIRDDGEYALYAAPCPPNAHSIKPIARHLISHLLNIQLLDKGLVHYDFQLSEEDRVIWNACSNLGVWPIVAAEMNKSL
ncbi:hypothetical protein ACUXK4_004891 [Methylorubrum extorquens]